ncbi:hypothetical protein WJX74_009073 [Apatococcus lobatus]|uniref:NAD(P)-binding domain-containing protein n=1 Tax=Apatococcus lobatus TaxID=904363 RepID=A0AAW1Q631_9CHLO
MSLGLFTHSQRCPQQKPLKPLKGAVGRRGRLLIRVRAQATAAFVAGATGGVGQEIVKLLLQRKIRTTALVRDPDAAAKQLPRAGPLLRVVKGDVYKAETLSAAVQGSNVMLIATGISPSKDPLGPFTVDFQGVRNLIRCGREANIQKVVLVSSFGVGCFPLNLFIGALFFKKRGEEAVQRSGMHYTILRPGKLLDELPAGQWKPGEVIMRDPQPFSLPPPACSASILRSQVAEVCVDSLDKQAASNMILEIFSDWST